MLKNKKVNLYIFNKKINNNYVNKEINLDKNQVGKIFYNPSYSKEWKNTMYMFNKDNMRHIPCNTEIINELVKEYFNLFFNKYLLKNIKRIRYLKKLRVKSTKKYYVGSVEVKHTNFKSFITVYVFDKNIRLLSSYINLKLRILGRYLKGIIFLYLMLKKECKNSNNIKLFNKIITKYILIKLEKSIKKIRKYKLNNNLNKYKFEENFLSRLGVLISRLFNKKIEFNVIKLDRFQDNPDMITHKVGLKCKTRKVDVASTLNIALVGMELPKERNLDKNPKIKIKDLVDLSLFKNKFKDLHIINILNIKEFFDRKLNEIYGFLNLQKKYHATLNEIKYKQLRGYKGRGHGRLTIRYRADRSVRKYVLYGGLNNIDSTFKGLKSVMYRGKFPINNEYSIFVSKRHVGAYAIKG